MQLLYELTSVPDLTLAKYQLLENQGVEGLLDRHQAFLRQWQQISALHHVMMGLTITHDPEADARQRVFLSLSCDNPAITDSLRSLLTCSPLSAFYDWSELSRDPLTESYAHGSYLKKRERRKAAESDANLELFTVDPWKPHRSGRLYDLLKTFEALDRRSAYHVAIGGVDGHTAALKALGGPIAALRKRVSGQESLIAIGDSRPRPPRDALIESVLRLYQEFLDDTAASPCFSVDISTYADDPITPTLLLNAAAAEAVEEGDYQIVPTSGPVSPASCTPGSRPTECVPPQLSFWPSLLTLQELAPFFVLPALHDGETIGLPKETAPRLTEDGLRLGTLEAHRGATVGVSVASLAKHGFVCGVPGSGKTNTLLLLADSLWHARDRDGEPQPVPFLVIEPAKREHRELARLDIEDLLVFSPGSGEAFPFQINPFQFPRGIRVSEHIGRLVQVFQGAFPMEAPAPFLLDRSIEAVYTALGWDLFSTNDGSLPYPTMSQLYREFERQLEATHYDAEIRGNIRAVLETRIGSLLRRERREIFDVERSLLEPEEWLRYPAVLELEALDKDTANFVTLLMATLIREVLTARPEDGAEEPPRPLRHVLFIEEAHNLIARQSEMESPGASGAKVAATEAVVELLREARALREGVIIADQLPTTMADDVIKNTNLKIVHRLTSEDDRRLVGSTMGASAVQLEQVTAFSPGQALASYEGLLRPFLLKVSPIPDHGSRTPDDRELAALLTGRRAHEEVARRYEHRAWRALLDELQHTFREAQEEVRLLQARGKHADAVFLTERAERASELTQALRGLERRSGRLSCRSVGEDTRAAAHESVAKLAALLTAHRQALSVAIHACHDNKTAP